MKTWTIQSKLILKQVSLFLLLVGLLIFGAAIAYAQGDEQIERLSVQLWPEFDQPETLVIAHGSLADASSFPATLTFNLPVGIMKMNAVAILADEGGALLNHPYELEQRDGASQLSFALDAPMDFYFEYYDPDIMTNNGDERSLAYEFIADYAVQDLSIEVQQPPEAENMQLSPDPDNVSVSNNQFTYHIYKRSNLAPGSTFSFAGTYQKQGDMLTNDLVVNIPEPSEPLQPLQPAPPKKQDWTLMLGYALVGLGAAVLVFAGVMWYINRNRSQEEYEPAPRRPSRKKGKSPAARVPQPKGVQQSASSSSSDARFCPHCGTAYKQDALFCHKCGKPRR